jgi:hypothetical protein
MSLFPGLFEAGVSNTAGAETDLLALLRTKYGLYALALLAGAAVQTATGSFFNLLLKSKSLVFPLLSILFAVSIGLEIWGYLFKGHITLFAVPGIAAASMCLYLLIQNAKNAA